MKRALLTFTLFLVLAFGTSAQEQPKPVEAFVNPAVTPVLQALVLSADQVNRLALAETQVQNAKAQLEIVTMQLFLEKGGTLADYDTRPQVVGQGAVAFVPKAKK
jgi:hypothetical protein